MTFKLIVTFTCFLLVANGTYVANYASSYNAHAINHDIRAGIPLGNVAYTPVATTGYQVSFPIQQVPIGSSVARLAAPFTFTQLANAQFTHQLTPTTIATAPSDASFINEENRARVSPEATKSSQPEQFQPKLQELNPTFQTAAARRFYNPLNVLPERRLYETPRVENEQEEEEEEENQATQLARMQNLAKAAPTQRIQQQQQQQRPQQQLLLQQVQHQKLPILRMTQALIMPANDAFRTSRPLRAQQQRLSQALENRRSYQESTKLTDQSDDSVEIKSSDSNDQETQKIRSIDNARLAPVLNPLVPNFYRQVVRF